MDQETESEREARSADQSTRWIDQETEGEIEARSADQGISVRQRINQETESGREARSADLSIRTTQTRRLRGGKRS